MRTGRRLPGFLSASGVVAAAVMLAAVLAWDLLGAHALFSPGPLNAAASGAALGGVRSHAQLKDCGACHTAPWSRETMAQRCLGCHTRVRDEVRRRSGLHGRMPADPRGCFGCHTEHGGVTAALTVPVDAKTFPHDLTGYSLKSHRASAAGAKVTCAGCHPRGISGFDGRTCVTCHRRVDAAFMRRHEATFGSRCLPCHDGSGVTGADFDHGRFPFKLTGAHVKVACAGCHRDATSAQALRDTPRDCHGCHAKDDEHRGRFGKSCGQCHSTSTWDDAKFDHAVFPVDHGVGRGKGECRVCHPQDVTRYTCFGCHEHTTANVLGEHEGRSLAQLTDCVRCHEGGRKGDD